MSQQMTVSFLFLFALLFGQNKAIIDHDEKTKSKTMEFLSPFVFHPRECENPLAGVKQFFCPTRTEGVPVSSNKWPCIRAVELCDGIPDCPGSEDEQPTFCMFHEVEREEMRALKRFLFRKQHAAGLLRAATNPPQNPRRRHHSKDEKDGKSDRVITNTP